MTPENLPLFTNRLENRPLPQLMSRSGCTLGPDLQCMAGCSSTRSCAYDSISTSAQVLDSNLPGRDGYVQVRCDTRLSEAVTPSTRQSIGG